MLYCSPPKFLYFSLYLFYFGGWGECGGLAQVSWALQHIHSDYKTSNDIDCNYNILRRLSAHLVRTPFMPILSLDNNFATIISRSTPISSATILSALRRRLLSWIYTRNKRTFHAIDRRTTKMRKTWLPLRASRENPISLRSHRILDLTLWVQHAHFYIPPYIGR